MSSQRLLKSPSQTTTGVKCKIPQQPHMRMTVWSQALGDLFRCYDPTNRGTVSLSALSGMRRALGATDNDYAGGEYIDRQFSRSELWDFLEVFCTENLVSVIGE